MKMKKWCLRHPHWGSPFF